MFDIKSAKIKVKKGFSQQHTKRNNTMLLFNLIRKNSPVSRIMLAEMTGLSATTVSMLMDDLIANNLVTQIGAADAISRGRRPIMLEVNGKGGFFILIEIINTGIITHLYDLNFKHIDRKQYRMAEGMQKNTTSGYIMHLLEKHQIPKELLLGINVIYPGIVDRAAKKMIYSAIVPTKDLYDEDEIQMLYEEYPSTLFMLNNYSTVTAYAEYIHNDYNYTRNIIAVNIFEAVGAGAILINEKGEIISDFPIEFGHVIVDRNGPLCKCGNRGCLESIVGICSIFKKIEEVTGLDLSYVDEFNSSQNIEAMKKVKMEVDKGNQGVIKILDEAADWIALGLNNMNNVIDAGYIFIGGTTIYLGEDFINRIRDKMVKINLKHTDFPDIIKASHMDVDDRLKGGVAMLIDEVFALSMESETLR